MRIVVTCGAGYIGSIAVRALADAGHDCVVLDTLERGHAAAVDSRAEFVEGSVGDLVALDLVLPGCDAVMHFAGYIEVGESQSQPEKYFRNNVAAPLTMLESMVRHGVGNIVFSSTAAVYGEPVRIPIAEGDPTVPINAYGASKLMFEEVLDWFERAHGVRSLRLRYFNVAGAWPDGSLGEAHEPETHLVPRILRAMGVGEREFEVYGDDYPTADGTCVRDYIHVVDLVEAHRMGVERLVTGEAAGVYNLGNGAGYSNLEVVRACAKATGCEVEVRIGPRRPGDPATLVACAANAKRDLGWTPLRGSLDEIVGDAWRWHCAHPRGWGSVKGVRPQRP